jgi:DNA-binding HxlR family transcriptional regulator
MPELQHFDHLLRFFKLLAEPQRLRIVGVLSERPRTVGELGKALHLSDSTVSHHLARLADAGLVTARAESYYNVYSVHLEVLGDLAKTLLRETAQPRPAAEDKLDAFDRKVLATFVSPDGRINSFPVQEKKYLVLIRHVLQAFEPGVRYTEKRVNQILANFNADTARLRRALVDYRYMAREGGGGKYWRIDTER